MDIETTGMLDDFDGVEVTGLDAIRSLFGIGVKEKTDGFDPPVIVGLKQITGPDGKPSGKSVVLIQAVIADRPEPSVKEDGKLAKTRRHYGVYSAPLKVSAKMHGQQELGDIDTGLKVQMGIWSPA